MRLKTENELIAEFMGFIYAEDADIDYSECGGIYTRDRVFSKVPIPIDKYHDADQYYIRNEDWNPKDGEVIYGSLSYDTSWDWLMPVVEKIDRLQMFDSVEYRELADLGIFATMDCVYTHVVEFIKWYNSKL